MPLGVESPPPPHFQVVRPLLSTFYSQYKNSLGSPFLSISPCLWRGLQIVRNTGVVYEPLKRDLMPVHENNVKESLPENANNVISLTLQFPTRFAFHSYPSDRL